MREALSSLLAIAIVRRLMLELKAADADMGRLLGHELEPWVSRSSYDFDGWTPAEVLASPNGEVALRDWLQRRLERKNAAES